MPEETKKNEKLNLPKEIDIPEETQARLNPLVQKIDLLSDLAQNIGLTVIDCYFTEKGIKSSKGILYDRNPTGTKLILREEE